MLISTLLLGEAPSMFDSDGWNTLAAFASAIAAIAAVVGVFLTLHTFRKTQRDKQSDAILAQCEKSLAAAYDVLTNAGASVPPERVRLNWLTSARHILRYKKLKDLLGGTHLVICDESEEYWRHKFYIALRPLEMDYGYYDVFKVGKETDLDRTIVPKSALVILAFSDWPEGRDDPMNGVSIKDLCEGHPTLGLRHWAFERHLEQLMAPDLPGDSAVPRA
ncbi:hypothetical protein [Achromobacter deleyi]|uniref:hypothetical protein n=1 Tax=Achromobacter deleyi TaxID=1353891 RepID=UPI001465DF08|nr:hypothetical protein [Achromobacter deleyi]CAB3852991.1 hypothetical protein LMG3412_01852 [Achromobacter deleyi]